MRWGMMVLIMAAVLPFMVAADCLVKGWPAIMAGFYDIRGTYPAAVWVVWTLLLLVLVGFCLYVQARWTLAVERRKKRGQVLAAEREEIREEFEAKAVVLKKKLDAQERALAERERKMVAEQHRVLAAAAEKCKESESLIKRNEVLHENVIYWLQQLDCAVEALTEDHESVLKLHHYLKGWVSSAVASPGAFIADVTNNNFDLKRFERCAGKIEEIQARFMEMQQFMQSIKKEVNKSIN